MKLLLIFNVQNDISFCHAKQSYLTSLLTNFHRKPVRSADAWEQLDSLVQIFSPLLATYNLMKTQLQSTYRRISMSNSEEIAFRRCDDFTFIGVFSKKTFCLPERQLANAERLVRSLVGPNFEVLKSHNLEHRQGAFNLLSALISDWKTLFTHELAFSFVAVERLKVSGDIKAKAIESIERSFSRRRRELATVEHALVVCGTKLLCLYSAERASRLVAPDFLTLISLTQVLFPKFDAYEDFRPAEAPDVVAFGSCAEATPSSNNSEELSSSFHSCSEPIASIPVSSSSRSPEAANQAANGHAANEGVTLAGISDEQKASSDRLSFRSSSADSLYTNRNPHYPLVQWLEIDKRSKLETKTVMTFLGTTHASLCPYKAHFVPITNNVVLIALESIEPSAVARKIDKTLRCLDRLAVQVNLPAEVLERQAGATADLASVKRMLKELEKALKASPLSARYSIACERAAFDVDRHCRQVEAAAFRSVDLYLSALENLLQKVKTSLKRIFESLFLQFPLKMSAVSCQAVQDCARQCRRDLQDYLPFLDVKARRNMASSSVLSDYAGMLHFAAVDRRSDEIASPTPDWGRHPRGLPRRLLHALAALRETAAALKARGGGDCGRKEIFLFRRDHQYQFSYLVQWETLQVEAAVKVVDPGFELLAVHHPTVDKEQIHRQLHDLIEKYLGNRESPESESTLL